MKTKSNLHCSLCGLRGSYVEIYDHAKTDHGLWHAATASAYADLVHKGIAVVAPMNKRGKVFRAEVWTTMDAARRVADECKV